MNGTKPDAYTEVPVDENHIEMAEMNHSTEFEPLDVIVTPAGDSDYGQQMALYEEDMTSRKLADVLSKAKHYDAGLPGSEEADEDGPVKKGGQLGTIFGVYLPCIQNIFGVILFIRLTWVVGVAGSMESFFIVLICCCTTLLTAISMSAIATNGVVPAGGSYFMISRALGPEFGGAVGVLFYLGTSVASSMYIIGAVEILITYMVPQMSIFGDITVQANQFNNFRVYGTCLLVLLIICVIIGVAFVSKFAPVSLFCVILSILSIYIGIFASNASNSVPICKLGTRLLTTNSTTQDGEFMCTKNESGPIFLNYCGANGSLADCDPYFLSHDASVSAAIPGIASGIFSENAYNEYTKKGDIPATKIEATKSHGEITSDITTSFVILLAIFFPSVTGIMAGSNRSGDLADAQKSIPTGTIAAIITTYCLVCIMAGSNRSGDLADAQKSIPTGTIAAILTTSIVYITCVLFFGATIDGDVMRDKFGESIGGGLVIANLAWPNPWVILVGSLLSTIGAGLQSLTGAPRLLQAIAKDGVIPFLRVFSPVTKHGEPLRAILLTACISEIGILIASLDAVAPVITMFFLMCYGFVNMACALQTLLKTPNWRPRFRFYHWTLSLLGLAMCIALMFISSWIYSIVAIVIAVFIYKYIEYKGAEQEWGDGITGLAMSAARFALLKLEEGPVHTKNWRPQLLILVKLDPETLQPIHPTLPAFGKQLKAGRGLTMLASVLPGTYESRKNDIEQARTILNESIQTNGIKGFAEVNVANDIQEALSQVIQSAGLGGLKPNTVVMGWPTNWTSDSERSIMFNTFMDTLKLLRSTDKCLLVLKDATKFPDSTVKLTGTIDVWWIVHEGGLLMLLPFLLRQHRTWKNCKLRIFTVAQLEDNSIKIKKDLEQYMYQLRIEADVFVVEMENSAISAYTYERTLMMEQRNSLLKNMQIQKEKIKKEPQAIIDKCHTPAGSKKKFLLTSVPEESQKETRNTEMNQFTFTPIQMVSLAAQNRTANRPNDMNVRKMHTALRLNEVIRERSRDAQLVVINMPAVAVKTDRTQEAERNYIEYLEVLTEGIDRCLLARGSGREVITIYS